MKLTTLLLVGIIIGSNNLAAAFALGSLKKRPSTRRVVAVFGLFEFFVPLVGLWLGQQVSQLIAGQLAWVGPALIAALGLYTIFEALRTGQDSARLAHKLSRRRGLMLLAAGLSIDNLIVGFGLGFGGNQPLLLAGVIATFSMTFAAIGIRVGAKLKQHHRRVTEITAGVILLALAGAVAMDWV